MQISVFSFVVGGRRTAQIFSGATNPQRKFLFAFRDHRGRARARVESTRRKQFDEAIRRFSAAIERHEAKQNRTRADACR